MQKEDLLQKNKQSIDKNAFANHNGIVISKIESDYAEGYIDIKKETMNAYGVVHGGAYFTLADVTAAYAARSDGKNYVTQQSSMNFIRGVVEGRISCKANVINRGRTFCIIESKIYDDNGKLAYSGTFNYFCVDR